jgi:RNA polymerase sigma factor (TIGR02999 family)
LQVWNLHAAIVIPLSSFLCCNLAELVFCPRVSCYTPARHNSTRFFSIEDPQVAEEITRLLLKWNDGDPTALDQLMPLVYDELRHLARTYLRRQPNTPSLQPTAVVNEAYLRLVNQQAVSWQNRAQFFGLAARLIRNLLVDHVRERRADKRGGGEYQLSLTYADRAAPQAQSTLDLLALHEALDRLTALSPQKSRVIELRYFGGLTISETAEVLGISQSTVEREWSAARAWLFKELTM